MVYLTFDEYEDFGGNIDDEFVYDDYEFEARKLIDYFTFNHLINESIVPDEVKRCMYKLIDILRLRSKFLTTGEDSSEASPGISSQSNDGVSVSYNILSASEFINKSDALVTGTIRTYLSGVKNSEGIPLLYRGVY